MSDGINYLVYDYRNKINRKLRFFFRQYGKVYYLNNENETELHIESELDRIENKQNKYNYFELFDGYTGDLKGVQKYCIDFMNYTASMKKSQTLSIEYGKYYDHKSALIMTFIRLCKGLNLKNGLFGDIIIENIMYNEFYEFESCHNGGACIFR
jgi:hypothetical protein